MADGSLHIGHVSKTYWVDGRALEALDDIELAIAPGEFITIVGASGSYRDAVWAAPAKSAGDQTFRLYEPR